MQRKELKSTISTKLNIFMKYIILFFTIACITACKNDNLTEIQPFYQDIREWVFAPGQLEWDDIYNLTAQNDGILTDANTEIGTIVNPGQIIATISNPSSVVNTNTAKDQLKIAEKNLNKDAPALQQLKQSITFAEEKLQQANLQAERYERLYKSESISKLEYENAMLDLQNSQTNLNALKHQYNVLMQQATQQKIINEGQYYNNAIIQTNNQIKAIRAGKIINKLKGTGDFVRRGEVIAVVANPSKIKVILSLDEKHVHRVQKGQIVQIQLNTNKSNIYNGQVEEIQSSFDDKNHSFACKVFFTDSIPSTLNIYGTPLEANILVGEKKNALLIPRSYMGYGHKVKFKGQDSLTVITPGIISTDYVEILEGLTTDDILIPIRP